MNILIFLLIGVGLFIIASHFYGGALERFLGVDEKRPTPAVRINDGRDYVPTKTHVLFAHHFSAIAGAGPILGPTMALLYGFVPAWLWIILGGVFIGAVHDFTALFVSMREQGKSMAEIARKTLGQKGFILFIFFTLVMVLLVTSAFLSATAVSLTSKWPIEKLGLNPDQTLLRVVPGPKGESLGCIGGIASTSVVVITLFSPILGYLIYRKGMRVGIAYPLAAIVCIGSVILGVYEPVVLKPEIWMVILSIYVLFAAGMPVWMILQPRDFINVQILYAGVIGMALALLVSGASGLRVTVPAFNVQEGVKTLGYLWPMLFITVACGAVSGFHALVATGTTTKQIRSERDARRIGYNAMLLESTLSLCVLLALGSSLLFSDYKDIVWPIDPAVKSNPILAFSLAIGSLLKSSFSIPPALGAIFGILLVEGFVITTLDAAVRINRYLFEELWNIVFKGRVPRILRHYWFNSGLAVILMFILAFFNAFSTLWPIFGTGNQLLAALSLIAISVWLTNAGKSAVFTMLPAIFMVVTTMASLVILFQSYLEKGMSMLLTADVVLLVMSLGVVIIAVRTYLLRKKAK